MSRYRVAVALSSLWLMLEFAGCGRSSAAPGAGGNGGAGVASGLDQPGALLMPPAGGLPAELLPPGLQLQR